jgi:hypothetical protein
VQGTAKWHKQVDILNKKEESLRSSSFKSLNQSKGISIVIVIYFRSINPRWDTVLWI